MTSTDTAPAAKATLRPTLTGIHHIGITVTDIEASVAWYERVRHYRTFCDPDGVQLEFIAFHG
ncbi:MAG: hypothetical protein M3235_20040 [Actinomycetota bacterium]|nr:hypothetical protein [Actinomycetota bacterium]